MPGQVRIDFNQEKQTLLGYEYLNLKEYICEKKDKTPDASQATKMVTLLLIVRLSA